MEGPGILRLNNRNPPLSPPCYGMFDAKIDPQKMGFLIAGLLKIAKPRLEIFNGDGFGIEKTSSSTCTDTWIITTRAWKKKIHVRHEQLNLKRNLMPWVLQP